MKYTIDTLVDNVNQLCNDTTTHYTGLRVYFDMAITEINTIYGADLPTFIELEQLYHKHISKLPYVVYVNTESGYPEDIPTSAEEAPPYYYSDGSYYIKNKLSDTYVKHTQLLGQSLTLEGGSYKDVKYHAQLRNTPDGLKPVWIKTDYTRFSNADLSNLMPYEFANFFLVYYVAGSFIQRDGGNADYQNMASANLIQLKNLYTVPEKISVAEYANNFIYSDITDTEVTPRHLTKRQVLKEVEDFDDSALYPIYRAGEEL